MKKSAISLLYGTIILAGIICSCEKDPALPTDTTNADSLVIITTTKVTSITGSTAETGGNITDDGGDEITARGVCWSALPSPTVRDTHTSDSLGTGSFSSSITGLTPETKYYVRAYAINNAGIAYGQEISFKTDWGEFGTFIDLRDNKEYEWVRIGDQVWMAENLGYLPSVHPNCEGDPADLYYYVFDYEDSNVSEAKATSNYQNYGVLYNWPAAMVSCPEGWHLPTDAEWTELSDYMGGASYAGGKLKEAGTTHWLEPNTGATNESGFTALPGGSRQYTDHIILIGYYGTWWSASEYSSNCAWSRSMSYYYSYVCRYSGYVEDGFSVRCLRN